MARLFCLLLATSLAACASTPTPIGEGLLRPGLQHLPTLQAQGDQIIATLQDATMTVQALSPERLDAYYARRPALVNPFKTLPKPASRPLAFILRIQNRGRDRISFDPSQAMLVDQRNHRNPALPYDELYSLFSEGSEPARALQALDETVLTGYVIIPPKLDREGLLLFPRLEPEVKAAVLEIGSFYIGSTEQLLLFEFEVFRPRKAGAIGMFGL